MTAFLTIFRRFPTTFQRFPKILQNLSGGHTNVAEHFSKFSEDFRRLSKIAKDFRGRPKMFWSYINKFKYNLRDKLDISEIINILTSEDMEIRHPSPGCVFVWILRVVYFPVKHSCLYNKSEFSLPVLKIFTTWTTIFLNSSELTKVLPKMPCRKW